MVSKIKQSGGCSDKQKGIAAQLRTFTHGDLREELNNIVHSGDSISSKSHHPSNHYIDLSNSFDSKVENVLKKAIDFIKDNQQISYKNKKKILNGIVNFNSSIGTAVCSSALEHVTNADIILSYKIDYRGGRCSSTTEVVAHIIEHVIPAGIHYGIGCNTDTLYIDVIKYIAQDTESSRTTVHRSRIT